MKFWERIIRLIEILVIVAATLSYFYLVPQGYFSGGFSLKLSAKREPVNIYKTSREGAYIEKMDSDFKPKKDESSINRIKEVTAGEYVQCTVSLERMKRTIDIYDLRSRVFCGEGENLAYYSCNFIGFDRPSSKVNNIPKDPDNYQVKVSSDNFLIHWTRPESSRNIEDQPINRSSSENQSIVRLRPGSKTQFSCLARILQQNIDDPCTIEVAVAARKKKGSYSRIFETDSEFEFWRGSTISLPRAVVYPTAADHTDRSKTG